MNIAQIYLTKYKLLFPKEKFKIIKYFDMAIHSIHISQNNVYKYALIKKKNYKQFGVWINHSEMKQNAEFIVTEEGQILKCAVSEELITTLNKSEKLLYGG